MKSRFISPRQARLGLLYLFIVRGQCHTRPLKHVAGVLGCCTPVVVTACEERFATEMTAQTTALRDQLMPFTLQIQAKTASNLTTCVIVQGAHTSQLSISKDKQEDGVVVASGVENQLVSHPGLDSVSTVDRTFIFSLHRATPGILT